MYVCIALLLPISYPMGFRLWPYSLSIFVFSLTDCAVFICDFHREQAWERWLSKTSNGCREVKDDVLAKLRRIARSMSVNCSEKAIEALKLSVYWKDMKYAGLVEYIERYWLSIKKVNFLCLHL